MAIFERMRIRGALVRRARSLCCGPAGNGFVGLAWNGCALGASGQGYSCSCFEYSETAASSFGRESRLVKPEG